MKDPTDNDEAFFNEDVKRVRQKHSIEAVLDINDVLYTSGAIVIDGQFLDAVVNVSLVMHGTNDFEIEFLEVKDDVVYMDNGDGKEELCALNYNAPEDSATGDLMKKFTVAVELAAVTIAKNTPEHEWNYRIIE